MDGGRQWTKLRIEALHHCHGTNYARVHARSSDQLPFLAEGELGEGEPNIPKKEASERAEHCCQDVRLR